MLILALAALLCLLGAAGSAEAAKYVVNSTGDQTDNAVGSGGCATAAGTCTLRAAIEESNASTGIDDTIDFDFSFDGQIGDTIELGSSLPTIVDRVRINGFQSPVQCETDYFGLPGPCVGVDGPPGKAAFRVAAKQVVLVGFAITGAATGIEAVDGPGLQSWNMWFGVKLDGSAGPLETGLSLDQGSYGALLGGVSSVARNIWAHNSDVGLDIEGANATVVRGSGFGVLPDGNTPAPNGTNIEITDAPTGDDRVAEGNWIGETLNDEQLASPTCDGGCNVIAAATESGIDLNGDGSEEPASGSTRIFGNHIGLNAFGTVGIPNAEQGVFVGSARNVTVGGPHPGDRNLINGGVNGILAGPESGNLTVEGNWIGLHPSGTKALAPPASAAIAIADGYQVDVTGNRIAMAGGTGIEQGAAYSVTRANTIGEGVDGEDLPGGAVGVHLTEECHSCLLGHGNSIVNATTYGVLIESSRGQVYGNRIESAGLAGIRISGPPPGGFAVLNLIGGDLAAQENTISDSGGAAIEIAESVQFGATRRNQVARNNGASNGGLFIDLVNGGNEEIPAPAFAGSTQSGASGTGAMPEATIRVFRKATGSPGEIAGFLAETVADGSGDWSLSYPAPVAAGTMVAASQSTSEEGTSELSFATAAAEQSGGGGGGGGDGGGVSIHGDPPFGPGPPAPDRTAPDTSILSGPARSSRSRVARFRFIASEVPARFRCRFDGVARGCRSPQTYRGLAAGKHVFEVWATDAAGNRDASPARWAFRVLAPRKGA